MATHIGIKYALRHLLKNEANNKTQSIDFLNIDDVNFSVMGIKLNHQDFWGVDDCYINESAAHSLGYKSIDKTKM